jgi:hypothetical protein
VPEFELAVEDYLDAISQTIKALGGFKVVGAALKPDIDAQRAGRWLADCCNVNERETLQPSQLAFIRRLARTRGIHTLVRFELADSGYAPPVPIEPQDEFAQLQRAFASSVEQHARIVERMEQIIASKAGAA